MNISTFLSTPTLQLHPMQIIKKLVYLMVGIAFVCLTSSSFAVAYWNCSSPTGPASGTWNETNNVWTTQTALFTYSPLGGMTDTNPLSWTSPDPNDFNTVLQGNYAAAFSLGTEPNGQPGPYTITVDNTVGTVQAGDFLVYSGPMTLTGGPLNFSYLVNGS